jgi:hypothetical protein
MYKKYLTYSYEIKNLPFIYINEQIINQLLCVYKSNLSIKIALPTIISIESVIIR